MNNPLSLDPEHALFPAPAGCTGHRIFRMLEEHNPGLLRAEYLRVFDRRNMLTAVKWNKGAARVAAPGVWSRLVGRQVVILGSEPRLALGLPRAGEVYWREDDGVRWCSLPHPSGRCLWYNDRVNRLCAGLLLDELYHQWLAAGQEEAENGDHPDLHPITGAVEL